MLSVLTSIKLGISLRKSPELRSSALNIALAVNGPNELLFSLTARMRDSSSSRSCRIKSLFPSSFMWARITQMSTSGNVPSCFTTPVSMGRFLRPPPRFMTSYGVFGKTPDGPPIVKRCPPMVLIPLGVPCHCWKKAH